MELATLKLELIQKIIAINEVDLLLKIKDILDESQINTELNEPLTAYKVEEKVYVFNEWQQERINLALKQIENGECISDEEAEKEIQAWLED